MTTNTAISWGQVVQEGHPSFYGPKTVPPYFYQRGTEGTNL